MLSIARFGGAVAALLLLVTPAFGQITGNTLALADASGPAGSTVAVDLNLANEDVVAGIQFDILFDPAVVAFEGVSATDRGAAMTAEGSVVSSGRVRVVLYHGLGGSLPSADGLIGAVAFRLTGLADDTSALQIDAVVLSDADGGALASLTEDGSLTLLAPANPPTLHIAALKNPAQTRTVQVMVAVTEGSGSAPTVVAGGQSLTMSAVGSGVFLGRISLSGNPNSLTISATDSNDNGQGQAQLVLALP